MLSGDVIKPSLVFVRVRTPTDVVVVPAVLDVLVERHHVYVLQTDVNSDPRITVPIPEEIHLLLDVSDVYGCFEPIRVVQVLQVQV